MNGDRLAFAVDCICLIVTAAILVLFFSLDGIH